MARRSPKTRPLTPREVAPTLYRHVAHPHQPRNVNEARQSEQSAHAATNGVAAFNQKLAVWLTAYVGTMWTAYGFAALALVGLLGVLAVLNPNVYTLIAWLSQTFIQLVLLPVIMVGQNVLNRHAEIQADEMFATTQHSFHDIGQMMRHLDAQDAELLRQTSELQRQTDMILRIAAKLALGEVATTPLEATAHAASPAAPDTHTSYPHSDAAATSPASPPAPAPVAATPARTSAPHAAKAPHAANSANSSASARSRRGAPASGQRRHGYQTSARS